jgi:DNA replication protein DnaC
MRTAARCRWRFNQRRRAVTRTQLSVKIFAALNLVYDEWPNFLGSRPMVEALLSRLRHYCHTVTIDGPSLRDLQG